MQIYLINLDRHALRLRRMEQELEGLAFQRIAAVDGQTLPGPAWRDHSRPPSRENLSRSEHACVLSHRAAWLEFLAGAESFACVLEDDVHLSVDFRRFISAAGWLPGDCDLMKIETTRQPVYVARAERDCLGRQAAVLLSLHYGTGGYIVSRQGAAELIARTAVVERPADWVLFHEEALRRRTVYQLYPALCVQASVLGRRAELPELASSIQPALPPQVPKTMLGRVRAELIRPFRQLPAWAERRRKERQLEARHMKSVPFA